MYLLIFFTLVFVLTGQKGFHYFSDCTLMTVFVITFFRTKFSLSCLVVVKEVVRNTGVVKKKLMFYKCII